MSFEVIKWVYNKTFVEVMKNTVHFHYFKIPKMDGIFHYYLTLDYETISQSFYYPFSEFFGKLSLEQK